MKKISYLIVFALVAAFVYWGGATRAENMTFADRFASDKKQIGESGVYTFDKAHSFIGFKVRHMGLIEVPGFFRDFTGEVNFDSNDVSKSTVNFKAMVTSVDTGVAGRDKHLRTADFFEVDKYPELTFKSTDVKKKGKGWIVTGDLTMKGVTKPLVLTGEFLGRMGTGTQRERVGFSATGKLNRTDYGIVWNRAVEGGDVLLGDKVEVTLAIEAIRM